MSCQPRPHATQTILLAGVGGQGVVLAGDALAEAAFLSGLEVKKSEIHGLSRRLGSVACQVRFGGEPLSPFRGHGAVDLLIALEIQEGLRNLPYLKPDGTALVNRLWIAPHGSASAVPPVDLEEQADPRVVWLSGTDEVHQAGCPKGLNFFMLGAAAPFLSVRVAAWRMALEKLLPARHLESNRALFALGRRATLLTFREERAVGVSLVAG